MVDKFTGVGARPHGGQQKSSMVASTSDVISERKTWVVLSEAADGGGVRGLSERFYESMQPSISVLKSRHSRKCLRRESRTQPPPPAHQRRNKNINVPGGTWASKDTTRKFVERRYQHQKFETALLA